MLPLRSISKAFQEGICSQQHPQTQQNHIPSRPIMGRFGREDSVLCCVGEKKCAAILQSSLIFLNYDVQVSTSVSISPKFCILLYIKSCYTQIARDTSLLLSASRQPRCNTLHRKPLCPILQCCQGTFFKLFTIEKSFISIAFRATLLQK